MGARARTYARTHTRGRLVNCTRSSDRDDLRDPRGARHRPGPVECDIGASGSIHETLLLTRHRDNVLTIKVICVYDIVCGRCNLLSRTVVRVVLMALSHSARGFSLHWRDFLFTGPNLERPTNNFPLRRRYPIKSVQEIYRRSITILLKCSRI